MSVISRKSLGELREFAEDTALGAGGILKKGFAGGKKISYKGRIDPVTEFDLKSEKYILGRIKKAYPDHAVLTEEGNSIESGSRFRWVIDPLDGTVNFSHGFPIYCVSVGLEYDGQPIVGAVYDPERDEMFSAFSGGGAKLNKKRIQVAKETRLDRALLATGFAYDIGTAKRNNLGLFARMARKAQGVRRPGSAAIDICWVAAGRIDGFWELFLKPWDTCAAVVILAEAGGKISRVDGRPYSISSDDLLATNNSLHPKMRAVLCGKK
jgi:myo-inositol-1(or 4)-monophosphatase